MTPAASKQLAYELDVIERIGLANFFLIVWDIVRFAQEQGIRYQGRGSAANSLVAYLLDITPVDPLRFKLLFERFLSPDRRSMPDIDIDFATNRREEVIQYVYARYGVLNTRRWCAMSIHFGRGQPCVMWRGRWACHRSWFPICKRRIAMKKPDGKEIAL